MSSTTFLSNEELWQTLRSKVKSAGYVSAAIAYIGRGGAKLLPLRLGDRLVVDMSLGTVRAGATDPNEIEKFIQRGVECFSRRNLHAKLVSGDRFVIAGSTNVSARSRSVLDEAAVLTNDVSVIRRAREFIDRLCTEPIRPEYLKQCKHQYRPPQFIGERIEGPHQLRVKHAKLWIVNLREAPVPESELERYEKGEVRANKLVKRPNLSTTDSFHWPTKPRMASELEPGDWIIQAVKYNNGSILVYPPGQLLFIDKYFRNRAAGKERYVFHLEIPKRGEPSTWRRFRVAAKTAIDPGAASLRTGPIRNSDKADTLLRLWNPSGRLGPRNSDILVDRLGRTRNTSTKGKLDANR